MNTWKATFETARLRTHRLQANLSTHILQSIRVVCVYISVSVSVGRQDFFIFVGTGRTCSALWILEDRPRALENCGVCMCVVCECRKRFFILESTGRHAPSLKEVCVCVGVCVYKCVCV